MMYVYVNVCVCVKVSAALLSCQLGQTAGHNPRQEEERLSNQKIPLSLLVALSSTSSAGREHVRLPYMSREKKNK